MSPVSFRSICVASINCRPFLLLPEHAYLMKRTFHFFEKKTSSWVAGRLARWLVGWWLAGLFGWLAGWQGLPAIRYFPIQRCAAIRYITGVPLRGKLPIYRDAFVLAMPHGADIWRYFAPAMPHGGDIDRDGGARTRWRYMAATYDDARTRWRYTARGVRRRLQAMAG